MSVVSSSFDNRRHFINEYYKNKSYGFSILRIKQHYLHFAAIDSKFPNNLSEKLLYNTWLVGWLFKV